MGKKKLFGTYCSIDFLETMQDERLVKRRNSQPQQDILSQSLGYNPIFVIPFENIQQFAVWTALSMPQHPQILILFETTEYEDINYMEWLYFLYNLNSTNSRGVTKVKTTSKLREYIVPHIRQEDIISCIGVTQSPYGVSSTDLLQQLFSGLTYRISDNLENTLHRQTKKLNVMSLHDLVHNNNDILQSLQTLQTNPLLLKEKDISTMIKKLNSKVFKTV